MAEVESAFEPKPFALLSLVLLSRSRSFAAVAEEFEADILFQSKKIEKSSNLLSCEEMLIFYNNDGAAVRLDAEAPLEEQNIQTNPLEIEIFYLKVKCKGIEMLVTNRVEI